MSNPRETPKVRAVLNKLKGVKRSGDGWISFCPAHEDVHEQSLSIGIGEDGKVLLNCFAGCETEAIVAELGLTWADLFPEQRAPTTPRKKISEKPYESRDFDGTLRAIHVRIDYDDRSKRFVWKRPDGTPGLGDLTVNDLPLYGSEKIEFTEPVGFIVEGQKVCDVLRELGVKVVATYGSGHEPTVEVLAPYTQFQTVCLWVDHDEPGRKHMMFVAEQLHKAGHTDVRIISWTGATEKGDDAFDFVARGGDIDQLHDLIEHAVPYREADARFTGADEREDTPDAFRVDDLTFTVEDLSLRDGTKATIKVMNGAEHPIVVERGNLDESAFRDKLTNATGVEAVEVIKLREHVRRSANNPTATREHTRIEELARASIEHGELGDDAYITTGLTDVDHRIGGFMDEQLIIVGGSTGSGKSSLMLNFMLWNAKRGLRSGFISLEMSGRQVFDRLVSLVAGHSVTIYNRSHAKRPERKQAIDTGRQTVVKLPVHIEDGLAATLPAVLSHAHRMKDELDLDILYIDQIHAIKGIAGEHRTELVGRIAHELKQMARDLQIPVVTAAQMNREIAHRQKKEPVLDDLRDSAEIAHQADLVLFVHHPHMYDRTKPENVAEIHVAKNREGATGDPIPVTWHGVLMKFSNAQQRGGWHA